MLLVRLWLHQKITGAVFIKHMITTLDVFLLISVWKNVCYIKASSNLRAILASLMKKN